MPQRDLETSRAPVMIVARNGHYPPELAAIMKQPGKGTSQSRVVASMITRRAGVMAQLAVPLSGTAGATSPAPRPGAAAGPSAARITFAWRIRAPVCIERGRLPM